MSVSDGEIGNYNSYLTSGNIHSEYRDFANEPHVGYEYTNEGCERHDGADFYTEMATPNMINERCYEHDQPLPCQPTPDDIYGFNCFGSPVTTASSPQEDTAWLSDTLHQHAYAKQRRSRHDPGGGASQIGKLVTPEVSTCPSSALQ